MERFLGLENLKTAKKAKLVVSSIPCTDGEQAIFLRSTGSLISVLETWGRDEQGKVDQSRRGAREIPSS